MADGGAGPHYEEGPGEPVARGTLYRCRAWVGTFFGTDDEMTALEERIEARHDENDGEDYITWGREVCPTTGRKHLQLYFYFANARSMRGIKGYYGVETLHLEPARGTPRQNITYCHKEGNFKELGHAPKGQGARTDMVDLLKAAEEESDPLDLLQTGVIRNPQHLAAYSRIQELVRAKKAKCWEPPEVHWIWGPPGTGKTWTAMKEAEQHGPFHMKTGMTKWFPDPTPLDQLVWDDFRPDYKDFTFEALLTMLGIGRCFVEAKGSHRSVNLRRIWITSAKAPDKCVPDGEDARQLLRRIKTVRLLTTPHANSWANPEAMEENQGTWTTSTFQATTTTMPGPTGPPSSAPLPGLSAPAASEMLWDMME